VGAERRLLGPPSKPIDFWTGKTTATRDLRAGQRHNKTLSDESVLCKKFFDEPRAPNPAALSLSWSDRDGFLATQS